MERRIKFQNLPKLFLYILCFPYVIYLGWKIEDHYSESEWNKLIKKLRIIQKISGLSPRDLFLLGTAHMHLNKFDEALKLFELIPIPLEDLDEESFRYCAHSWVLYKLGRVDESKAILEHSMSQLWPSYRTQWANEFMDSIIEGDYLHNKIHGPTMAIH
jgi:tetratricopeptide (TPR) repeat protein